MTQSITSGNKSHVRGIRRLSDGENEVMARLNQYGGVVTTAAPGPTHLVRRLWRDSTVPATDDRVQWCIALIQSRQIKCRQTGAEGSATYRCATPEELAELSQ